MTKESLYKSDIALWGEEMARLLRERRFDEVDVENVAEVIESLGRSDMQQLENRIIEIIEHMLMTPAERSESARTGLVGGKARAKKLTAAKRSAIAKKAGLAGGRGRKKAQ